MVNEHYLCRNITKNNTFDNDEEFIKQKEIRFAVFKIVFALGCIHIALALLVFFAFSIDKRIRHIEVRSRMLVLSTAIGVFLHTFLSFSTVFVYPFPTWIFLTIYLLVVPLTAFPIPVKLFNFYGRYIFSRAVAQAAIDDASESGSKLHDGNDDNMSDSHASPMFVIRKDVEKQQKTTNYSNFDQISNSNKEALGSSIRPLSEGGSDGGSHVSPALRASNSIASAISSFGSPEKETALPSATEAAEAIAAIHQHDHSPSGNRRKRIISSRELFFLKFIASPTAQIMLLVLYISPYIIVIIYNLATIPELSPIAGCDGAAFPSYNNDVALASAVIAIIFGISGALSVRKFYDPFGIATECRQYLQYGGIIAFIGFLLDDQVKDIPYGFSFDLITSLGFHIMLFTSTSYQVYIGVNKYTNGNFSLRVLWDLLVDIYQKRKPIKLSTLNSLSLFVSQLSHDSGPRDEISAPEKLLKMLDNPKETEEFEKFLIGEFSVEMLRMYLECRRWEKNFFDSSEATRRARAKKIVEHFIDYDSIFEVNIPGTMRSEIIKAIENNKVDISPDLFKKAQKEMLYMMDGPYLRFEKRAIELNKKV